MLGYKKGRIVQIESDQKKKVILGTITGVGGYSVSRFDLAVDIEIDWFEPLEGDDSKCYSYGAYDMKGIKRDNIIFERE